MEFEKIKIIVSALNVGSEDFWEFIEGRIRRYSCLANEFPWGCFPVTDQNNILTDIRVLVPVVVDEKTLLVNIHELTHAYELYGLLGKDCVYQVDKSEEEARGKEKLYLKKVQEKSLKPFI